MIFFIIVTSLATVWKFSRQVKLRITLSCMHFAPLSHPHSRSCNTQWLESFIFAVFFHSPGFQIELWQAAHDDGRCTQSNGFAFLSWCIYLSIHTRDIRCKAWWGFTYGEKRIVSWKWAAIQRRTHNCAPDWLCSIGGAIDGWIGGKLAAQRGEKWW